MDLGRWESRATCENGVAEAVVEGKPRNTANQPDRQPEVWLPQATLAWKPSRLTISMPWRQAQRFFPALASEPQCGGSQPSTNKDDTIAYLKLVASRARGADKALHTIATRL